MGRFQLESIYLVAGTTVENKGKLILLILESTFYQ